MEPKCTSCYYFLEVTDANNTEHKYYCLGDNYPYAMPADIKGCRFWDKNVCFKEKEDKNASKS